MDRQPHGAVAGCCFSDGHAVGVSVRVRVGAVTQVSTHPEQGAATSSDAYLPDQGNGGYRVRRYHLDIDYRLASNRLAGRARIEATATQALSRISFDLANLRVAKVSVDGRRAPKYVHRGNKLHVWTPRAVPAGTAFVVEIGYGGTPRPVRGPWGEVGWEELTEGVIVAGQPNGASSWFPCNDHPSDKAGYRIAITTDSPYRAIANGSLISKRVQASRTTWVYEQPEPMATYLATIQIGRYELLELTSKPVPQRAALPAELRKPFAHDFGRQPKMMAAFRELFGPYPFAGYTVVVTADELEIPLEAQGMSVFGANHLDGERGSERLVAHELAHQWFGNSLTVGRWQDIWLHEGFACYAEWLWSEESGGQSTDKLARHWWDRLRALPQDLVIADPGRDLMFDDRLYKRGALTLHALRLTVGDKAFFAMLRNWVATYRHGTVSTNKFLDHVQRHCGVPHGRVLEPWLQQARLPELPRRRERS
jgi:aminopeptidase